MPARDISSPNNHDDDDILMLALAATVMVYRVATGCRSHLFFGALPHFDGGLFRLVFEARVEKQQRMVDD